MTGIEAEGECSARKIALHIELQYTAPSQTVLPAEVGIANIF
jgi:hypothetical protein